MHDSLSFDVFLSHNSRNKALVRTLALRLLADGVKVWFDEWEIAYGTPILHKIDEGLAQSRTMILFMSEAAFQSDWVQLENISFRHPDVLNKAQRFIPVLLDNVTPPPTLRALRFFDWRTPDEAQYRELLAQCLPPRAPAALPAVFPLTATLADTATTAAKPLQVRVLTRDNRAQSQVRCAPVGMAQEAYADPLRVEIACAIGGQLLVLYMNADGTLTQLFPNTCSPLREVAPGTYCLPGELLPLPHPDLGLQMHEVYFQNPGQEMVIAMVCPQLPATIGVGAPLQSVNAAHVLAALAHLPGQAGVALAYWPLMVSE